jgi:hypothetical protein
MGPNSWQALVGTAASKVCPLTATPASGTPAHALETALLSDGGFGVKHTSQSASASPTVPKLGEASKNEKVTFSPGLTSAGSPRTASRVSLVTK